MQVTSSNQSASSQAMLTTGASMSVMSSPWGSGTQKLDSPIGQRFLQAISDKTGISPADLTSQLQGGASVQSILHAKGLTMADIRDAVRGQAGKVHAHGHRHHADTGTSDASTVMDALASALGMSGSDLATQLSAGNTLDQLASDKGISMHDLARTVLQSLQSASYAATGSASPAVSSPQGLQVNETA